MKDQIPFLKDVRRSRSGLVLGVFKGLADSKGWPVFWTRLGGGFGLMVLSGIFGGDRDLSRFFIAAFFYLLLAVLIPSETAEEAAKSEGSASRDWDVSWDSMCSGRKDKASASGSASASDSSVGGSKTSSGFERVEPTSFTRSDLAELSRSIERLNRRIQRIESVVTDRDYEWERKMNS